MSDYETKPRGGEGSGGSDAGSSPRREDLPGIADYDAARSAVSSGDLYGAISSLKRATAADDGCAEYWYNLGAAQSNLAMQLVADDESAAVQAFRDGVDSKKRAMELMKTGGFRFYTPEEQQQVRFDCEQALDGVDDVLADERSLVAALHLYAGR